MFADGEETVSMIEETLEKLYTRLQDGQSSVVWPIPLLIVDINMPYDGLQVTSRVKELYRKLN